MSVLKTVNIFLYQSRAFGAVSILKRFHSTDIVSKTISNDNGRLRLEEEKYCNHLSTPIRAPYQNIMNSISDETVKKFDKSFMMVSETQSKLLHQLVKLLQPKSILEVGGFTGYSAIAMASALQSDSTLVSLELEEQHAEISMRSIKEAGLQNTVSVMVGPADKSLVSLYSSKKQFDFIFLDANKGAYIKYFDFIMDNNLLTKNGLIIADNVLTFGQVHKESGYDKENNTLVSKNIRKTALKMHKFNEHVYKDSRVEVVMLPIFDGISLIRRIE